MSYILEALKKAESERQLGSPPGLHAAPTYAAGAGTGRRGRIALWAALAVLGVGAASFAWIKWPAGQKVRAAPTARVIVAAPTPTPPASAQGPLFAPAPAPAKVAVLAPAQPVPKPSPQPEPKPEARPAPAKAAPLPEESYPMLRDLPDAIARELPQVAIGGYIYSKNPGDSLLLVDKTLRREGEEVAPGLVLEKLLPKSAVMNYRGYRYRVPY